MKFLVRFWNADGLRMINADSMGKKKNFDLSWHTGETCPGM
jgi:hypothetical protein